MNTTRCRKTILDLNIPYAKRFSRRMKHTAERQTQMVTGSGGLGDQAGKTDLRQFHEGHFETVLNNGLCCELSEITASGFRQHR